jgi:hypothetical protein
MESAEKQAIGQYRKFLEAHIEGGASLQSGEFRTAMVTAHIRFNALFPESEHEKMTGHKTAELQAAYDRGYEANEKVIMDWIAKWDGSTNSAMGELLNKKMNELWKSKK